MSDIVISSVLQCAIIALSISTILLSISASENHTEIDTAIITEYIVSNLNSNSSWRDAKDLLLQNLEQLPENSEPREKIPPLISLKSLLDHPEWIFNNTEEKDSDLKIYGPLDMLDGCLDQWEAPVELQTSFPIYLGGYDDENKPVWIVEAGKYNVRKIVEEGGPLLEAMDKYMKQSAYRIMKSIMAKLSAENRNIEARFLMDMEGLNIAQLVHLPTIRFGVKYARKYSQIMSNFMGSTVFINANYPTEIMLNIGRPILPSLFEKLDVYGTNKANWLPKLRRHFPVEVLPEWYGGSKNFTPLQILG